MRVQEIITEDIKWLRPGELRGSYTDQQLQKLGFRKASNGSWFISTSRWRSLVAGGKINEVTQIQEIEQIPFSDYTGHDAHTGVHKKSNLPTLTPLKPRFYYALSKRHGYIRIDIYYQMQNDQYENVAALAVDDAGWLPVPAMQVSYIAVHEEYENQGLGQQLYKLYFDQVGLPLVTGESQTPGGQLMWQKLWQDPEIDVVGLIGIEDDQFDLWDEKPEFRKWIDDLMDIGGESLVGDAAHRRAGYSFHWFLVPLRQMSRQMAILKHFKLYPSVRDSWDLPIAHMMATKRSSIQQENFADGRNPQDRGDSRRHGIPKKATIAQLKKIRSSKTASPRKKQLAHWQINMRQGKKK